MSEERAAYDAEWNAARSAALRERLGVTQAEFARRLGIRQQTVSEWETGRYRPRGASITLLHMAEVRSPYDNDTPPEPGTTIYQAGALGQTVHGDEAPGGRP